VSLSKKNSRPITVNNEFFRWVISQDSGYICIVVQHNSGKGAKLDAIISHNSSLLAESNAPHVTYGGIEEYTVTPAVIARLISCAIDIGWQPLHPGPPLQVSWNDKLVVRHGLPRTE
jgi:hypothetical protein